jgi:hypothetical protein
MADQMTDLLQQIPIGDIAQQLGIDDDTAEAAVKQVLPGLVGGMQANAAGGGAASLEKALGSHAGKKVTSLSDVDTDDGRKIVKNVFGEHEDSVAAKLAENDPKPNVTMDIIQKVLPIVAPIVLSYLAQKFLSPSSSSSSSSKKSSSDEGGIGGLLGGLLGDKGTQDALGGLLGGLLGGGKK